LSHHIHTHFTGGLAALNARTSALSHVTADALYNGPYAGPVHIGVIAENMELHKKNMEKIAGTPEFQGGIYAGAAGFVNMGYIAHSRASAALLFDINAYQSLFWNLVLGRIMENNDCRSFRQSIETLAPDMHRAASEKFSPCLRSLFRREADFFGGGLFKGRNNDGDLQLNHLLNASSPDGGWMHDDALYGHIRSLACAGAIGAVTLDIANSAACAEVARYLDDRGAKLRLLYVSNILNFMQHPVRHKDFIGRAVTAGTRARAQENLYGWMEEGGRIIECDNLVRNRPLMIEASSFVPRPAP